MASIKPGCFVRVTSADTSTQALVIRRADPDVGSAFRDPNRPRRMNQVSQVTLPAALMDEARLTVSQWVYLSRLPGDGGVLVEPAGAL